MIEMPQLRLGKGSRKLFCLRRAVFDGEGRMICAGHDCLPAFLVDNSESGSPGPCLRIRVAEISRNGKLSVPAGEIRNGFDIDALYKSFRSDEQLHRPIDTPV